MHSLSCTEPSRVSTLFNFPYSKDTLCFSQASRKSQINVESSNILIYISLR